MKKLFSVIIALCCIALAQAQAPIAMLKHGNTFTPFYGTDALARNVRQKMTCVAAFR